MADDEHLMHGWEPDTPVSDSLVRMFLEGTAVRGERLAESAGKRATRQSGVAMADLDSPVFFDNTAVLLAPCDYLDRDEVIAAIDDFYAPGHGVLLFSAFPTWDLRDAGFALMGHPPFMVRPAGGEAPPLPDDLVIRHVDSPEEATNFARTLEAAYPLQGAAASPLVTGWRTEGLTLFNGYYGDRCVATGGAWNSEGINDVGWISAMPETRRRGVGQALTFAATMSDPSAHSVLIASDDGVGVYERMGYVRLFRMTLWVRLGR